MSIARDLRKLITRARHAAVIIVFCGSSATTGYSQVVDLPTSPLGADPATAAQPPTPEPPRLSAPGAQPPPVTAPGEPTIQSPSDQSGPLNFNPNAPINDLAPPPPGSLSLPQTAQGVGGRASRLGATSSSFSGSPTIMGDFFGNGLGTISGTQVVSFGQHSAGTILTPTSPGAGNATIVFEFGGDVVPNDIFTVGVGQDLVTPTDGADTFMIAEPLPPNDALTSPGPGYVFDGGTAVYTNSNSPGATTAVSGAYQNGEQWYVAYTYSRSFGINPNTGAAIRPIPEPGIASRRVKIAENFSPEVRDRFFSNYNFFNDAFGGLGDISRYVIGFEKVLFDQLVSIEARLPMAGTYGSYQSLDNAPNRDFELGDPALILKGVLLRTDRMIWSGGMGVTVPLADDTVIQSGRQKIIEIKNETVHLLPFTGLLLRMSRDTFFQSYLQLDVVTNGDPVFGNLTGGPLPLLGKFTDSTLLHADVAMSHSIYRNRHSRFVKQMIANAEVHYTGTLQKSDFISSSGLTYTNLKPNFNIVNTTLGMHLVLSNNLIVSPGMSIPLRNGLDEQFDYEALVQVNYLR